MQVFLGLDGGGTGCRAVLADHDGRVLGRGEGGPANIMSDREGALAEILKVAGQAMAGHEPAQVVACLGLAGANMPEARDWLAKQLPFGRCRVVHDAMTAVAGALGPGDGIVAAIGTGSVFSRQIGGKVRTIGGWGPVLGDEAGGAWMGRLFLGHVLRSVDGIAQATPLTEATLKRFGGGAGIVALARDATGAVFAAEARHMLEWHGDPACEAVLSAASDYIKLAITRLQPESPLPVTFTGGLGPIFADRLFDCWSQRPARGNPLDGALRLATELA